jgi:predicted Zn-dependent protease
MRPLFTNGRRGAEVFIRPDTDGLGPEIGGMAREDALMRDTIVYLTCVHELGHALGLNHTGNYADIMYFFGFGGDIPGFFRRYREQIRTRGDIARVSGVSQGDVEKLRSMY